MIPLPASLRSALSQLLAPAMAFALLGLALALMLARADARHWEKVAQRQADLRQQDRAAMVDATRQATFDALMNVYRVSAARAKIDERTIHALDQDRTAAAAAYQRLRQQTEAYLGAPGSADLSAQREATCRAVAGTGCHEIPALLKAAQDNTDQLLRWIEWGKAQGAVPTAPPPEHSR